MYTNIHTVTHTQTHTNTHTQTHTFEEWDKFYHKFNNGFKLNEVWQKMSLNQMSFAGTLFILFNFSFSFIWVYLFIYCSLLNINSPKCFKEESVSVFCEWIYISWWSIWTVINFYICTFLPQNKLKTNSIIIE